MLSLSVNDPQLSSEVQRTLNVLLNHGISKAGKHRLSAAEVGSMGLSPLRLRELVTTGVAEVTASNGGQVLRRMAPVATEVELFDSGDTAVAITLSFDLAK